jgi:hypothetical protein
MRRLSEAAKRAALRRERENAADRLSTIVPGLERLTIRFEEASKATDIPDVSHVRHIVVHNAPALFEVACCDRKCDGEHDLTKRILRALKGGKENFEWRDACGGNARDGDCEFSMRFYAEAHYAESAAA